MKNYEEWKESYGEVILKLNYSEYLDLFEKGMEDVK